MSTNLQQAISAIKLGDKETGRRLLTRALQANPQDETAWLWLAYAVDSEKQRRECLERVLAINPAHEKARHSLAALGVSMLPPLPCPQPANHTSTQTTTTALAGSPPPAASPLPFAATSETPSEKEEKAKHRPFISLPTTIALLLITLAILIGTNLIERWAMWSQLAQAGVTTEATIVDARVGEGDARYITYRFAAPEADGEVGQFEVEERVSQELYNLLGPGSRIKIQYLFGQPTRVRMGGSDNLSHLFFWTALGLLTGVVGFSGLVGAMGGMIKQSRTLFKKKPAQPKVVWQGEGPPPLKQWTGTYTLGQDNYEGFFVIETDDGIFLGEGGMEILKSIPDTEPKQPIAFDVGLFDKTDITTLSRVIMSESAYNDATLRATVEANPNAETILAQPGAQFTLDSTAMRVEAKIDEMEYGDEACTYFKKLTVSLAIFLKEGVDLAQPMEVPDQFK